MLRRGGEMKYQVKITFETNTELDEFEVEDLLSILVAQVQEPVTWKGEPAQYETKDIEIDITP